MSLKFWVGLLFSVILLALFVRTVGDFGRAFDALADAEYIFLVPGIALYLISVFFRTLRWQILLRHLRPVSVRRLYPVVVVGYMANNLLPVRLGEFVRSYYLSEREGISKTSALVTIFIERVLDALALLFFIAAISLFVPLAGLASGFGDRFGVPWPLVVAAVTVPFVGAFATLLLFAIMPDRTRRLAVSIIRLLPTRLEEMLVHLIDMFLEGLKPLANPRTLTVLLLISIPIWLFEAGLFFMVGFSFGLNDVYDNLGELAVAVVLVTAIANIGSSIPAAPGGIGAFELIASKTLVLLPLAAVDPSVAAGFAVVVHAALLIPMILLGQIFLWFQHISLRRLSNAGGNLNEAAQTDEAADNSSSGLPQAALSAEGDDVA